jgi:hypothetical protein
MHYWLSNFFLFLSYVLNSFSTLQSLVHVFLAYKDRVKAHVIMALHVVTYITSVNVFDIVHSEYPLYTSNIVSNTENIYVNPQAY